MESPTISRDEFLQQKDIQIERSSFLADHYARKSLALRDSYNPRDPYGSRLSSYWQPGDTVWSVIMKKIIDNVKFVLNPDTFTREKLLEIRTAAIKYKVEIVGLAIVVGMPVYFIYPFLRPRLSKIRRDFLFQYYLQSQLLAKRLDTSSVKIPLHEMQQIIRKSELKVKL